MTRRDYVMIAKVLSDVADVYVNEYGDERVPPSEVFDALTGVFNDRLSTTNLNYDSQKFRAAARESWLVKS